MNAVTSNSSLAIERQERIRARLQAQHIVRVDELADWLHVSPATIRRDLDELEQQGRLPCWRRAGCRSRTYELPSDADSIAAREKRPSPGTCWPADTVFLDGGGALLAWRNCSSP